MNDIQLVESLQDEQQHESPKRVQSAKEIYKPKSGGKYCFHFKYGRRLCFDTSIFIWPQGGGGIDDSMHPRGAMSAILHAGTGDSSWCTSLRSW